MTQHVNGVVSHEPPVPPIATALTETQQQNPISAARMQQIREQMAEPFDPGEIKWRVTATSTQQTKKGTVKRGQLVAYADQRAYTDRLNDAFGEWGWTRTYAVQVAQNFERVTRQGPKSEKQSTICAKVVVVSTVTIHGLGSHTGVGEEWADDENSATRAEAQAFKRACACFGLGRYLYDLDKVWEDLDQHGRPARIPNLPDWAAPGFCKRQSQAPAAKTGGPRQPRSGLVREETLARVKQLCETVGFGLAKFALQKYGGTTEPERVGFSKLTTVLDKLTDMAKGIERLRTAGNEIGEVRYAAICRELNLASESIDDIPDRQTLQQLVQKVEAEAGSTPAQSSQSTGSQTSIEDARGRLLQVARNVADGSGRRLADVIADASSGTLSLDRLKSLTDSDVPVVENAILQLTQRTTN